jgi:hypothetical protein
VLPFITPLVIEVDTLDDFAHLEFQITRMPGVSQKLFN